MSTSAALGLAVASLVFLTLGFLSVRYTLKSLQRRSRRFHFTLLDAGLALSCAAVFAWLAFQELDDLARGIPLRGIELFVHWKLTCGWLALCIGMFFGQGVACHTGKGPAPDRTVSALGILLGGWCSYFVIATAAHFLGFVLGIYSFTFFGI